MKVIAAFLILALLPMQEKKESKDPEVRRVSLKIVNAPMTVIVEQLREETGIPIEFSEEAKKRIDFDCSQISLEVQDATPYVALQRVFHPRNFKVVTVEKKTVLNMTKIDMRFS